MEAQLRLLEDQALSLLDDLELLDDDQNQKNELLEPPQLLSLSELQSVLKRKGTELDLRDKCFGIDGARILSQFLQTESASSIYQLDLTNSALDEKKFEILIDALLKTDSILSLWLGNNSLRYPQIKQLSHLVSKSSVLTQLNLENNHLQPQDVFPFFQALTQTTSLVQLDLELNDISDEGSIALAEGLKKNSSLTELNLSSNLISNTGLRALSQFLKESSSLQSLSLNSNSFSPEGAISLFESLQHNHSLISLSLANNSLGTEASDSLAQTLSVNTSLTELWLSATQIGPDALGSLSSCLAPPTCSVVVLCLNDNPLNLSSLSALSSALKTNTSLQTLGLTNCSLTDECIITFCQGLESNSHLSQLWIDRNRVSSNGLRTLCECLKHHNKTLSWLKLSQNPFDEEGFMTLSDLLKSTETLQAVWLNRLSISPEIAVRELCDVVRQNTSLVQLSFRGNNISEEQQSSIYESLSENPDSAQLKLLF
eukprot:TRINITY_DN3942_c0_g1_i1.p1 TRINITY_DN3942_c0_g1~~TRINITY_DN3942_c0_g1_i1.p1  ORF type:complete len:495 (-),score=113.15 TRINITY_DN3942_c0_g1_i1:243-1697(-)